MVSGRLLRSLFAAVVLLLLRSAGAAAAPPTAGEPWDEPFTPLPATLLRAAEAVPVEEEAGIVVLLEEGRFTFEADGRETYRYRTVYRVLSPEGVKNWAGIEAAWRPWYEERPEIRARVCTRDGRQHVLDPATLTEGPVHDQSSDLYTDSRRLRAPLPAVAVGTVVEQEIVIREKTPLFSAGVVQSFYFGKNVPVHRTRLVIEAPPSLPLRYVTRLLPTVQPRREEVGGLVRFSFESGPQKALTPLEDALPPERPRWPRVTFSTGASWAAVSARYGALAEAQLRRSDVTAVARQVLGTTRDRKAVISRLLEHVQAEVRYTAVELGAGSIVPRIPGETLQKKYGDCKDQAVLLVALLRASGIEAQMALLRPGLDEDVEADLPGLGSFSHAIVHVPGTPSLWIDPTVRFGRAGELPASDQGRRALVISGAPASLVRTPEGPAQVNRVAETREFFLSKSGPARVVETTEAWGSFEQSYRDGYLTTATKTLRDQLEQYVRAEYAATSLSAVEHSKPQDLSRPFRLRLEVAEAKRGFTDPTEAAVLVRPGELTRALPPPLGPPRTEEKTVEPGPRREDYLLPQAFVSEQVYRIVPPPGFVPAALPESVVTTLGPARLTQQWALGADGIVTGALRFEIAKRRLTAAEFEEMRQGVRKLQEDEGTFVRFDPIGDAQPAAGRTPVLKTAAALPREAPSRASRSTSPPPAAALPSLPFASEVSLLPADSELIVGLDVRGLVTSSFWNQLMSGRLPDLNSEQAKVAGELRSRFEGAMKDAETQTGLRPDQDLDWLVASMRKVQAAEPEAVGLMRGRFGAIRVALSSDGWEKKTGQDVVRKTLGLVTVYQVREKKGKPSFSLAFLSDQVLVFGDLPLVESVVTAHARGQRPLESNPDLAGQVRAIKPGVGVFMLVGKGLLAQIPKGGPSAPPVPIPQGLALFAQFDGSTEIIADMATESDARNLADMVQGGLAMARMQVDQSADLKKKMPGVQEVLAGLTVEAEATTVRLSAATGTGSGVGVLAALAIPSLLQARNAAKEENTVGISAVPLGGVEARTPSRQPEAPAPGGAVRVGGPIREPRKLMHANPQYPEAAKQARVQGTVTLECTINGRGLVTDVKVLQGNPLLDPAAIAAVKQWVYSPTLVDGVPVPVIMTVTVNFHLS